MHIPVLLQESLQGLNLGSDKKEKVFVDATVNGGGHSEAVAKAYKKNVRIVGIDLDAEAIERSNKKLASTDAQFDLICDSYVNIGNVLKQLSITHADAVLFDFGLSSDQYESGRGFGFKKDEPLLMTFKSTPGEQDVTAKDVVNTWELSSLETVIFGFGEERYAKRIAKAIVESRKLHPIETTGELVEIISAAVPKSYLHGRIHPATRTFQAIRIAVNGELTSIDQGLKAAFEILAPGGRICAISFHSLEDRIVKNFFKEQSQKEVATIITKKPIVATDEEVGANPRSRSAKLRILQKL